MKEIANISIGTLRWNLSLDFLGTIVILDLILFLKCSYIEIIFIFE